MRNYAAMLRAVNLGSRNRIAMPDLRALIEALGAEQVETYVQSGNVVFRMAESRPKKLVATIEDRIAADLGLHVNVLLRTSQDLAAVVADNPFARQGQEEKALHVTFCADAPARDRVQALGAMDFGSDQVRVAGRDVLLSCPDGYGRSKLSNSFLEKKLGVVATTRNWRTVRALAQLAGS